MYSLVLSTLYTLLLHSSLIKGWTEELFRIRRILQSSACRYDFVRITSDLYLQYTCNRAVILLRRAILLESRQLAWRERCLVESRNLRTTTQCFKISEAVNSIFLRARHFPNFFLNSDYQTSHKYHK